MGLRPSASSIAERTAQITRARVRGAAGGRAPPIRRFGSASDFALGRDPASRRSVRPWLRAVPLRIGQSVRVTREDEHENAERGQRFWLVIFRRVLWSFGAVLVQAPSELEARLIVRRERPDSADQAKIRPAPPALVLAALGKAPLARRSMPILR